MHDTHMITASEILREDEPIHLSLEEWERFITLLDAKTTPGSRLTAAMKSFFQGTFENGRYHGR